MAIVVPHVGELQVLNDVLNHSGLTLRLFSNNVTLTVTTVKADLTEVSGGGYAAITFLAASWNYVSGTPSRATYSEFLSFDFTGVISGSGIVYGYYILDPSNNLLWGENVSSVTPVNGTSIPILASVTLQSVQQ